MYAWEVYHNIVLHTHTHMQVRARNVISLCPHLSHAASLIYKVTVCGNSQTAMDSLQSHESYNQSPNL